MTITLTREEAQSVLDVIERNIVGVPRYRATELLRARLAQPEPKDDGHCQACDGDHCTAKTGCVALSNPPERNEPGPVAWIPIEHKYPTTKPLDILMADGSILRGVFPQFDGDLWWEGSCAGEKFINPEYADITHWRIHSYTAPPQREWQGLTDEEKHKTWYEMQNIMGWYSFQEIANAIEAKLKEKNV